MTLPHLNGRKGWWLAIVFIERLWRSLKYECVYLNAFDTGAQARVQVGPWLRNYNQTRPHSTFSGSTPDEVCNEAKIYPGHAPDNRKEAA